MALPGASFEAPSGATIQLSFMMGEQPVWFEMFKQATALKRGGQLDQAIELLFKAKGLMCAADKPWERVEHWLKLPMYLSHAKRFDEGMAELTWLLETVEHRLRKLHPNRQVTVAELALGKLQDAIQVNSKIILILKRAKRLAEVSAFEAQSKELSESAAVLYPVVQAEQKARLEALKESIANRHSIRLR
jgi:hypothetical protein